jgi:hypothetical protein
LTRVFLKMSEFEKVIVATDDPSERAYVYLVTPDDKEELRELSYAIYAYSDARSGRHMSLDYVLDKFDRYIAASNTFMFGLRVNSALVAFSFVAYLDDGKTQFGQGQRVGMKYRKRGYSLALERGQSELLRRIELVHAPRVERVRWTKLTDSKVDESHASLRAVASRHSTLLDREHGDSVQAMRDVQRQLRADGVGEVTWRCVGYGEAFRFFKRHRRRLLDGDEAMLVDWVGYEPCESNFALLEHGGHAEWERQFFVGSDNRSIAMIADLRRTSAHCVDVNVFGTELAPLIDAAVRFGIERRATVLRSTTSPPAHYRFAWLWFNRSLVASEQERLLALFDERAPCAYPPLTFRVPVKVFESAPQHAARL